MAARDFLKAPTGSRRQFRQHDLGEKLGAGEIDRERIAEKIARRDGALAGGRRDVEFGVEQQRQHRQFGRRIGMRQAAADGAAVADGQMRHMRHGAQDRTGRCRAINGDVSSWKCRVSAPMRIASAVLLDIVEAGDAVDIDQNRRPQQAEIEHRHKALPAGKNLRVAAGRGQGRDRHVDTGGGDIVESGRLHRSAWIPWGAAALAARRQTLLAAVYQQARLGKIHGTIAA